MKRIVWIGKYQEDFSYSSFNLIGSITIFGKSKENYFVFEDSQVSDELQFIAEKIKYFVNNFQNIYFYFYDQTLYFTIKEHFNLDFKVICINNYAILKSLNNKALTREWFSNIVKCVPYTIVSSAECNIDHLSSIFKGYDDFIIQEMESYGGIGTYLLTADKFNSKDKLFIASPFFKDSIPINVTLIIGRNNSIAFPLSIQIVNKDFIYCGADFIASTNIPNKLIQKINKTIKLIICNLQLLGYCGICGVDFLIYDDELYFLELNARFQASTFLINATLNTEYSLSIFDINFNAFDLKKIINININNINYSYLKKEFYSVIKKHPIIIDQDNQKKRLIFNHKLFSINNKLLYNNYYDYFADIYHLMILDWEDKIKNQGRIIANIINKYSDLSVKKILDCTCGIGTQSLSLSMIGYDVIGSDISERELKFAKQEAEKRNLNTVFIQADCRYLEKIFTTLFDAVISIDSALPHLLTKENFLLAFKSVYDRLKKGGIFLSSFRDYEQLISQKPNMAYPIRFNKSNGIEYTIFRKWEWDNDIIASKQYVIEETPSKCVTHIKKYKQWAITKDSLFSIAKEANYSSCFWILPESSGFSQPLFCAVK